MSDESSNEMNIILKNHKREIASIRRTTSKMLNALKKEMSFSKLEKATKDSDSNNIFKEKENITSLLVKLSGLMIKIIPIEQQLFLESFRSSCKETKEDIEKEEDIKILDQYIEREIKIRSISDK